LVPPCPECAHEWTEAETAAAEAASVIRDANGTKVENIRLVDGEHDIDCKINGVGAMKLKSEFVKKV
jgi:protein PhnA